jgi:hypothetical protein
VRDAKLTGTNDQLRIPDPQLRRLLRGQKVNSGLLVKLSYEAAIADG